MPPTLEAEIIAKTIGLRAERLQLRIEDLQKERRMAVNLPNLRGVKSALDKLHSAVEDDAKDFIERRIPLVDAKRKALFEKGGKADQKLDAYGQALGEIDSFMDELGASLGNGNPTSDGSSGSSETKA